MEEARSVLFILVVIVFVGLVAAWLFCTGLSEVVHWEFCAPYLAFSARVVRAIVGLVQTLIGFVGR